MRTIARYGLLGLVGLGATAFAATSAHAQTPVSFLAEGPTLTYGASTIDCETGTAEGTRDAGGGLELELGFVDCTSGAGSWAVNCDGTVSVTPVTSDTGTAVLNPGFMCVLTIPFTCTITASGPQDPPDEDSVVWLGESFFEADVTVNAARSGSSFCGPASGPLTWAGFYGEQ
jgi:hypothetical protein